MIRADSAGNMPRPMHLAMHELASITVTFNPDIEVLEQQLRALAEVRTVVIIDNASEPAVSEAIKNLSASMPGTRYLQCTSNTGLAAAVNRGLNAIKNSEIGAILLLDQDSIFSPETPRGLLDALNAVQASAGKLCCVGPGLRDPDRGMNHGFHHVVGGWRWSRADPPGDTGPFAVTTLNGSGTTMPLALVDSIGGLEEEFFIDHIDTEWSFRVTASGGGLYGIPSLTFEHRMGEAGRRVWLLGWRLWPERSPLRHYYLFRNTVRLMRRSYVPPVWKTWAALKLVVDMVVTSLIDVRRGEQAKMMVRGIREGWRS